MNFKLKKEWPLLMILGLNLIAGIIIYPHMPQQVPIHWNINGDVDNYGSKEFGTFFLPVLNIMMYVFFIVLPKIDPKKANYTKFESSYMIMRYTFHIFFLLLFVITSAYSLGYNVAVDKWVPIGVCIMIIILGNVMGRVRHNYFVGFKYPWTLANEEVWKKTHQLGSKLMVAGGFLALAGTILTKGATSFIILMIGLLLPAVITTIYSYIIHKKQLDNGKK